MVDYNININIDGVFIYLSPSLSPTNVPLLTAEKR